MFFRGIDFLRKIKRSLWRYSEDPEYAKIILDPVGQATKYHVDIVQYALSNVPYYKQSYEGLQEYPPLNKEIIKHSFESLKSLHHSEVAGCHENTSGGSTGIPARFLQDAEYDRFVRLAMKYFFQEILGYDLGFLKTLMIWGSEKDLFSWNGDWKKKLLGFIHKTRYVNAFSLSESNLEKCIQIINTFKPDMIRGYASSLLEVAMFIKRKNMQVHRPIFLVSSAETLTEEMRQLIQEVFDRKIFNFYGSRECGAIAGECKSGLMHIFSFNHHVEVIDAQDREVNEGDEGRVLVTTLHNRAMPLLRSEIGDIAIKGPLRCLCGNPLPTVRKIKGRISDNFITRDGNIIHGEYFTHLFYYRDWVRKFQVIQEDYDWIRINLALNPGTSFPTTERQELIDKIRLVMGGDCRIDYSVVDDIEGTPRGKFLFTLSKVYQRVGNEAKPA